MQEREFCSCSSQFSNRLDEAHSHWGGPAVLLSSLIQMLISVTDKHCHRQTENNIKPDIWVPYVPGDIVVKNLPANAGDTEMQG